MISNIRTGRFSNHRLSLMLIAIMFFITGFVALTYQVTWNKILSQTVGIDHLSMTLVISIFMLGLGLGSQLGSTITRVAKQPIVYFFVAELLITIFGYFSSPILRWAGYTLGAGNGGGPESYSLDFIVNFAILLFPCILMGISLPVVTHQFRNRFSSGTATGFLYSLNLFGAALGAYISGVFVIGQLGLQLTAQVVSCLNLIAILTVAAAVYLNREDSTVTANDDERNLTVAEPNADQDISTPDPRFIYLISFAVGFIALAAEMIYFRLFMLYFRASSYVFPTILASYLLMVAIGNIWSARQINSGKIKQALATLLIFGPLSCFIVVIAPFVLRPFLGSLDRMLFEPAAGITPLINGFLFSMVAMIPVAFIAAFFPLFIEAATKSKDQLGSSVGRVYMIQTLGNFLGAVVSGLVVLPWIGPLLYLKLISLGVGFFAALTMILLFGFSSFRALVFRRSLLTSFVLVACLGFIVNNKLFHKYFKFDGKSPDKIVEDFEGSALFYKRDGGTRIQLGSEPASSYVQIDNKNFVLWPMDAVFAMRKNAPPKKVLIIGLGTGIKANAIKLVYPDAEIVVIELLGALVEAIKQDGSPSSKNLIDQSEVHITDGRRFVNKSKDLKGQFDIIELGVNHITSAGSGALFTTEFLTQLRGILSPTGVLAYYAYLPSVKMADPLFRNLVVASPGLTGVSEVLLSNDPEFDPAEFTRRYLGYRAEILSKIETMNLSHIFQTSLNGTEFFTTDRSFIREKLAGIDGLTDDLISSEFYLGKNLTWDSTTHDLREWKPSPSSVSIKSLPESGEPL